MPDASPHEQAIGQAVTQAHRSMSQTWDYADVANARSKLELESRGPREKLLAKVNEIAYVLATHESPLQPIGASLLVSTAGRIWETAARRSRDRLSQMANTGQVDAVYVILDQLDPPSVQVSLTDSQLNYNNGVARIARLRQSSGVSSTDRVNYLYSPPNDVFARDYRNSDIIIGYSSIKPEQATFSPQTIADALDGRVRYKPSWTQDSADVPLVDRQGRIHLVHLTHDAIAKLRQASNQGTPNTSQNSPTETPAPPATPPRQEIIPPPEKSRLVIRPNEITPLTETTPINTAEYGFGNATLASPDHPNHDSLGASWLTNQRNQTVGLRLIVADGAGGTLDENYPDRDTAIAKLAASVVAQISAYTQFGGGYTLDSVQKDAQNHSLSDWCPAAVSVALVDIYAENLVVSRRGDPGVALWRPGGYTHRRSEVWGQADQGGPSNFMTLDRPQNMAYAQKHGAASPTAELEIASGANTIYCAIGGEPGGSTQTTTISRSSQEEWLIVGTDGARLAGMLTDPNTPYSQEVHQIMTQLSQRKINEKQAATMITQAARSIPDERDDISAQVVRIPPLS
jgi:hypothetical protein